MPCTRVGAARPLRILLLDSWPREPARGSGTAVGMATLALGLGRLGHEVVSPSSPSRAPLGLRRLAYNIDARQRAPTAKADLIIGVDIDGFALGGHTREAATRHVVCLKGVAADEAQHEHGRQKLQLRLLAALERRNARRADWVIVPSRYSADRVAKLYGLDETRIAVVPEGIDLWSWRDFVRAPAPEPRILTVARQYPRKNTRTLVAALPALLPRVPAARLRVVGGGPGVPALEARAAALGVADRVDILGELDAPALRTEFAAAHCFALPSRREGFGIVFLEAMAAGLPVVAARAGAVPEVVADGETALLVDPDNVAGLTESLARVLTDPALARAMGEAGRCRVQRYDVANTAALFLDAAFATPGAQPNRLMRHSSAVPTA